MEAYCLQDQFDLYRKKNLLEFGRKEDIAFGGENRLFCLGKRK